MLTDEELASAAQELAARDAVMARLVERHGPPRFRRRQPSHVAALARAIAYQQLSGASASAIWSRVVDVLGGAVSAERILAASDADLRGAGLSAAKLASIRDLATRVASGEIPLRGISRLDDEAIIDRLVAVRGIGRWTAEMFLIFQLRRPDVWPIDDLGVRRGYAFAYRDGEWPTPKQLEPLGEPFRPLRSVASWYLWRASETQTP